MEAEVEIKDIDITTTKALYVSTRCGRDKNFPRWPRGVSTTNVVRRDYHISGAIILRTWGGQPLTQPLSAALRLAPGKYGA